jgi:HrpA-like RNA helicase
MERASKTCKGKCWRLYTENTYKFEFPQNTLPEILRTNLSNVILLLKSMGFNDVISFNYMDQPPLIISFILWLNFGWSVL